MRFVVCLMSVVCGYCFLLFVVVCCIRCSSLVVVCFQCGIVCGVVDVCCCVLVGYLMVVVVGCCWL